jgi:protoporphyrinogen oxidase
MAHLESEPGRPVDYHEWLLRQYGETLTVEFYEVFTRKYWRHDTHALGVDWLGGRLIPSAIPTIIGGAFASPDPSEVGFNRFHYPRSGGFYAFFGPMFDKISAHTLHEATEIRSVERSISFANGKTAEYEVLVSSIPLPRLISITTDAPQSVRDAAAALRHTRLICVNVVLDDARLRDVDWMYIYDEDVPPSRVSFPGNLSGAAGDGGRFALQAEVFRRPEESINLEAIGASSLDRLASVVGFDIGSDLHAMAVEDVPYAYVVSDRERSRSVAHIQEWLQSREIYTIGLYGRWNYIWSDQAFQSGVYRARQVRESK